MVPPIASVAGGIAMAYLAVSTPVELAVADYSRIEQLTEERFARDARAAALGLTATLTIAPHAGQGAEVLVTLHGADAAVERLELALTHVARRDADRTLALTRATSGADSSTFAGDVDLAPGRYDAELRPLDASWRLAGSLADGVHTVELRAQQRAGAP
jgi:hypothetical protein